MDIVGVILGGGEGKRFSGDKLAALVDGEASITRIARVLRAAGARLVYVITREEYRCKLYKALAGIDECLYDPLPSCRGPGAALASLDKLSARIALIAPGDAPWLSPTIYENLLAYMNGCEAAAPLHGSGFIETLVMVMSGSLLRRARLVAEKLCLLRGDIRPSDYLRLASCSILVGSSLLGVYSPSSFAHINTREALRTRSARNPLGDKNIVVIREEALRRLISGDSSSEACLLLRREAKRYEELGVLHLARHAMRDLGYLCKEDD